MPGHSPLYDRMVFLPGRQTNLLVLIKTEDGYTLHHRPEYVAAAEVSKERIRICGVINDLRVPRIHFEAGPLYIDNEVAS
jgi:hypothetical protein